MFGKNKKQDNIKDISQKTLFVRIYDKSYTINDIEQMSLPELEKMLVLLDINIKECQSFIESNKNNNDTQIQNRLQKTTYVLSKMNKAKLYAEAIKRTHYAAKKNSIEHYFIKSAKQVLTENQYNKIMVKAQAAYELQL